MAASVLNYFIGKGIISFTPDGGTIRDMGNAPEVEITPTITTLPHYSSREGTRSKDREVVTEKGGTLRIVLDEITPENVGLLLMSEVTADTGGTKSLDLFSLSEITGAISFVGTNDIGQQVDFTLPKVSFKPNGGMPFITDEWGQIELTAEILIDTGSFGTATFTAAS